MSRSLQTDTPKNPAIFFAKWSSDNKCFQYYKKSEKEGEKGENVDIKLPVKFLVLDILSTIKGYNDNLNSGFYSNEVKDLSKEELVVKCGTGEFKRGLYKDIKDFLAAAGGKFCASIYGAYKQGKEMSIVNFQIYGAALGQWIEFTKNNNVYKCAIEVADSVEGKKGRTIYNMPVFRAINTTQESDEKAKELDKQLQEYLTAYFKSRGVEQTIDAMHEVVYTDEPQTPIDTFKDNNPDELPF